MGLTEVSSIRTSDQVGAAPRTLKFMWLYLAAIFLWLIFTGLGTHGPSAIPPICYNPNLMTTSYWVIYYGHLDLPFSLQWRIQDFPQGGALTPKIAIIFQIFAENCMKVKEFGAPGGGASPWYPPLDLPMFYLSVSSGPIGQNSDLMLLQLLFILIN